MEFPNPIDFKIQLDPKHLPLYLNLRFSKFTKFLMSENTSKNLSAWLTLCARTHEYIYMNCRIATHVTFWYLGNKLLLADFQSRTIRVKLMRTGVSIKLTTEQIIVWHRHPSIRQPLIWLTQMLQTSFRVWLLCSHSKCVIGAHV